MWPAADDSPRLLPVVASDFESLLALRIRAMRPSLEALGRFSPERARERFAARFAPAFMHHLVLGGERAGLATLRATDDALVLDHLYIEPTHQRHGLGAWVLDWARARADLRQVPLFAEVLQGSDANRFYARHGFVEVERSAFDITYRRAPCAEPVSVLRALWACFQARDWAGARQLVHDDLHIDWWASGEALTTGDAFIAVNAEYPQGWSIHPMHFAALDDGRALSFVRVEHPPHGTFLVQSVVRVRDGRIAHGHELWSTCEAPPAWRTPARFPGLVVRP